MGHDVRLFLPSNHEYRDQLESLKRVDIKYVGSGMDIESPSVVEFASQNWKYYNQFAKILEGSKDLDLLHILTIDILQFPLLLSTITVGTNCPIVATVHRDQPFRENHSGSSLDKTFKSLIRKPPKILTNFSTLLLLSRGDIARLLTHSSEMSDRLSSSKTPPGGKYVKTTPAPTSPVSCEVSQEHARDHISLPINKPMILFFGEMRKEKGPDLLIDALKQVDEDCLVVFAGKPGHITKEELVRVDLGSSVDIEERLEYIPEDDVDFYFLAADILALPYRRREGISGPLRKAVMANTEIIGPAQTDIGAIINREDIGETFKHGSAEALAMSIRTCLRGENNSEGVRKYSEKIHYKPAVNELVRQYKSVVKYDDAMGGR
jgi:glycosyltransferase involved in cell wall biosynthesis